MSFKNFYDGDVSHLLEGEKLENARKNLKETYDNADDTGKAHIEKSFDEKIKDFWPLTPENQTNLLMVVEEIIREVTASGI